MAGFPGNPKRTSFGPQMIDTAPVRDPRRHVPASALNLLYWQVAGCSLVVPKLVVKAQVDAGGSAVNTIAQTLAWDPNGEVDFIEWTYNSAGYYSFELDAGQYEDENGELVTLNWLGGLVIPQVLGTSGFVLAGVASFLNSSQGAAILQRVSDGAFEDPDGDGDILLIGW